MGDNNPVSASATVNTNGTAIRSIFTPKSSDKAWRS